jgi:hypothetical protein
MAEFLSTRGISYNLEEIIKNTKKELLIITPFLKFSTPIYEQLKRVPKSIKITFIYGKKELHANQDKLIKDLNCDILFKDNLHAKCYMNEQTALICSMNLYEYSEVNNYEMGVIIDSISDKKAYDECRNEVELISLNASKIRLIHWEEKIEEYNGEGFSKMWIKYLKSYCNGVKYEESDTGIMFFDYPAKNINLTTNYGIVSFEIQLSFDKCRKIRDKITQNKSLSITNYRVFWSNPYDKIHLYWEKKIKFNTLEEELEYGKKGFLELVKMIGVFEVDYAEDLTVKDNSQHIRIKTGQVNNDQIGIGVNNQKVQAKTNNSQKQYNKHIWGFCLRCGVKLPFNPNQPYCKSCYSSWSYWQNYDFPENMCHCCGEEGPSSMGKPLCSKCC